MSVIPFPAQRAPRRLPLARAVVAFPESDAPPRVFRGIANASLIMLGPWGLFLWWLSL